MLICGDDEDVEEDGVRSAGAGEDSKADSLFSLVVVGWSCSFETIVGL